MPTKKKKTVSSSKKVSPENREFPIVKFKEGEAIRSLDQGKLYQAKVITVGAQDQYFIHYQGWNKKWDKWIHASLLMSEGPEAVKYAAKLLEQEKQREELRESNKRASKVLSTDDSLKRKKIKQEMDRSLDTIEPSLVHFKLPIPFTLKKLLVEDWEKVTQIDPAMLVILPLLNKPTVHMIIEEYLSFKNTKKSNQGSYEKLVELFRGLEEYFDTALPVSLLYRQERDQYTALVAASPGVKPASIYGGEHLLRLFTKLPLLLSATPLAPVEASQLQTHFGDFLKYVQKNSATLLESEYQIVSATPITTESKSKSISEVTPQASEE